MNYSILTFATHPTRGERLTATIAAHLPAAFNLLNATSAPEAYAQVRQERVIAAVIVLEPEGEGLSLARELREHNPRLTILCVRYPDTPAFQQALVGHLGLPVVAAEAPQITDALQRLIGQKRLHAFTADAQRVQHEARELRSQMEQVISQLNYVPGVEAALLADGNGMTLVHWERVTGSELGAVAGLAVGALSATRELAALLGARTTGSLIIQEFEAQTVIVARIARQHVLLLIIAPDTALGAIRLTLRRLIAQLEPLARGNLLRLRSARPASKVKLS